MMKRNSKQLLFFLLAAVALTLSGCHHIVVNYKSVVESDHSEVVDHTEVNPDTKVGLAP
jgi:hypothetical protein